MVDNENEGTEEGWSKRIDELTNKEMIKPEQNSAMKDMVNSPDKENLEVAKEIIKIKVENHLMVGLSEDQTNAFVKMLTFLNEPNTATDANNAFVLKGYAGTGKTFLVKRIIEYITNTYPKRRIAITAPTNKAVRVLQADAPFNADAGNESVFDDIFDGESRLTYSTIHKLLGLKEQITKKGEQLFKPDPKDKSDITKYKYLIVDEVSMLDDILCREILKFSGRVKIIFMGDPAQIPPVNRADCIPFTNQTQYKFKRAELQEIMRQNDGNPIIEAAFKIRNNLTMTQPIVKLKTNILADGKGVIFIDYETDKAMIKPFLNKYFNCTEFKEDANYCKVIAWKNDRVNYFNTLIREILYGKGVDPYVVGEKLIAGKSIFKENIGASKWENKWRVALNTSEEMEIMDITLGTRKFSEGSYKLYSKIYKCEVRIYDPVDKSYVIENINIIHEDSHKEYMDLIKLSKDMALKAKDKRAWISYFNILKWSANVSYNYAITAHKAQGSTYQNVLVLEENLDDNPNTIERNRIKYTAYSRPSNKLFILRKN